MLSDIVLTPFEFLCGKLNSTWLSELCLLFDLEFAKLIIRYRTVYEDEVKCLHSLMIIMD